METPDVVKARNENFGSSAGMGARCGHPLAANADAAVLQPSEVVSSVPTLDLADRVWSRLCTERDAACDEVSECVRATESGSVESYIHLRQARHRAKTVQDAMLRLLDLLDDGQWHGGPATECGLQ